MNSIVEIRSEETMLDLSSHTLNTLFSQLGLPASDEAIYQFIQEHKIEHNCKLISAEFWTVGQVSFLQESLQNDSDWTVLVDQLDVQLR